MNEYTDRDALRQAVLESQHNNPHPRGMAHIAHDCEHAHFAAMIARFPAADVAPVTRCKDCKHKGWVQEPCHGKSIDYCKVWDCTLQNPESTFCSYGEPKEGANADDHD